MNGRVLLTADAVGGVWTFALDLARALATRGHEVSLAVMGPPPSPAQRAEATCIRGLDLHVHPGRLEWMADPWDDVRAAGDWLLTLERRAQPDVIHLNGYCHGALPWRAPVLITAHSCVRTWWRAVHGCEAPAAWDHYRDAVARGLRAATLVTAPTRAMLAGIEACYGQLPRTEVIVNGRSMPPGRMAAKEPFVLSAGRIWDEAKNVAMLRAAAPAMTWPVLLAGDAGGRNPQGPNVRWLGWLETGDLAGWMRRAAIYALPARYEPFGLSALEAAQAGCALVLGDIPSLREVWGDAALFVPPGDARAIAGAVNRLAGDAALRRAVAVRAGARARTLTPERMAASYGAAYARLSPAVAHGGCGGTV